MKQKHIVIVGGTKGSGRVLVRRYSDGRNRISLIGRDPSPEVEKKMPSVMFYSTDLGDPGAVSNVVQKIVSDNGKINSLIFFQRYRGKEDHWDGEVRVSLTATKQIIESTMELFDNGKDNAIVIVSSVAGHLIHLEQPVGYHVVKAGINQMVRYYAVILGPKGIRINCVSPSTVIKEESKHYYSEQRDLQKIFRTIIPLQRMGTSEDLADVIEYLCSAKSSFITGQEIIVDGGLSLIAQSSIPKQLETANKNPGENDT